MSVFLFRDSACHNQGHQKISLFQFLMLDFDDHLSCLWSLPQIISFLWCPSPFFIDDRNIGPIPGSSWLLLAELMFIFIIFLSKELWTNTRRFYREQTNQDPKMSEYLNKSYWPKNFLGHLKYSMSYHCVPYQGHVTLSVLRQRWVTRYV